MLNRNPENSPTYINPVTPIHLGFFKKRHFIEHKKTASL